MHVLDGYLDPWIAGALWLAAGVAVGLSAHRARERIGGERVALFGVVAAAVFAAQLLNWPIPGGTSAHFVGGALAAVVLGPWLAVLAMTVVVGVQAVVFGDGGIAALGANVVSMAVVDVLVGYALFRTARAADVGGTTAAFVAGWGAVTAAALVVGASVGASSAFGHQLGATVPVMVGGHALLGVVEGAITAAAYRWIATTEPGLVSGLADGDDPVAVAQT